MAISEQQDKQLDQKLKTINTVEIQSFISEFHNAHASGNTLTFVEENFIKKYRYRNSLIQNTHDPHTSVTEFINGFKESVKFYQAYHQFIQSTLDKYSFTKDLKHFTTQLYKSQTRALNFFLTQLEFHRVFIAQNEAKYNKKVESLNEVCSSCKENMVRKSFQSIKQEVGYNFTDPYKLYNKAKPAKFHNLNHFSTHLDSVQPFSRIDELQEANTKMRQLIMESKRIDFSKLDEIYEHFDKKQEAQMYSVNKGKVNDMFYDLQTQLDNQSSQLMQYVDQLMGFNDRLVNYNPSSGVKMLQNQEKDQTEPKDVEKQLKYNLGKIIRKIYKKITEIIEKRKQESIDQQTQVNFNKESAALKQMDKLKKKLQFQLRQSKEEKKFLTSSFKLQSENLRAQIQRLSQENNKNDIFRQEALVQKNTMQRRHEKFSKVINQLKKQIERLNSVVERKQYLASKKELFISGNKLQSEANLENEAQEVKGEEKQEKPNNGTASRRASRNHLLAVSKVEHIESQSSLVPSSTDQSKSPQQELLQELQRHERELINDLAKKKLRINKKKYLQPRRSKIIDSIHLEDSDLKKQVSRFSQIRLKEIEGLNHRDESQDANNVTENGETDDGYGLHTFPSVDRIINEGTIINQINEQNQNEEQTQQQDETLPLQHLKNHKSKTFNQVNQQSEKSSDERIHSARQIQETEEEIKQKLEELRKLKKMKEIQMKMTAISTKITDGSLNYKFHQKSANEFQIEKQVQQKIIAPKSNKSVDNSRSLTKKSGPHREIHHQSLYKDEILKRFGRSSRNLLNSPIQSKSSFSHLQLPHNDRNSKSTNQQQRRSSISIRKNFLSVCEQVEKHFEEDKNHVGTQTLFQRDELLRMLYEFELQRRNWNEILVSFGCFRFGYQEFINQLCQLIAKQQRNPIRRLHGYKGSSDLLKKSHNYRFNKENLLYLSKQDEGSNLSEQDLKLKKFFSKDEKHYFIPRFSSQLSKNSNDEQKMNQTTAGSFFRLNRKETEETDNQTFPQKPPLSSVSLADLKSSPRNFKAFDPSILFNETNGNFKKKGFYTLHQMKTDGNSRQTTNEVQERDKLPVINQTVDIFKMPAFDKEDAQNLFFTIESAKTIEENIKNNNSSKNQIAFVTLENQQIRFTTQLLAILAHIHLLEPNSYNQIKNVILCPAKVLTTKRTDLEFIHESHSAQDSDSQISLKKGLGYVIQLHRKCIVGNNDQIKQRLKTKENNRLSQTSLLTKNKNVCQHLTSFRKKIGDVVRVHQALKTKILMKQHP